MDNRIHFGKLINVSKILIKMLMGVNMYLVHPYN